MSLIDILFPKIKLHEPTDSYVLTRRGRRKDTQSGGKLAQQVIRLNYARVEEHAEFADNRRH